MRFPKTDSHHHVPSWEVLHDQVQVFLVLEGEEQLDDVRRVDLREDITLGLDMFHLCVVQVYVRSDDGVMIVIFHLCIE